MTYDAEVLADSPAVYLKLDETSGTTAVDAGSLGINWLYDGGTTLNQSPLVSDGGHSVHGNGVATQVVGQTGVQVDASLQGDNVTMECWVDIPGTAPKGSFVSLGNAFVGWDFGIGGTQTDNTGYNLILPCHNVAWNPTSYTFSPGVHHVVVVRTIGNWFKWYVDGVFIDSAVHSVNNPTSGYYYVGGAGSPLSSTVKVDNVAIYPSALTGARIAAHYYAGTGGSPPTPAPYAAVVLADSPLAYYRMGEASGTTLVDVAGHDTPYGDRQNGTYSGSPTLGSTGLVAGDADTAVTFTGTTSQVATIPEASWMHVNNITVTALIKPNSVSGQRTVVARQNWNFGYGPSYVFVLITDNATLKINAFINNSSTLVEVASGNVFAVGTTYHVALTFDGTTLRGYVNGSEVVNGALSGNLSSGNQDITIGRNGGTYAPFDGVIDEVAIYGTALSPTRIAAQSAAATGGGGGTVSGSATLTGSGTLSTSGIPALAVSPALAGSGALSTSGTPALAAGYALSGSGVLSGSTAQDILLTGSGTLTGGAAPGLAHLAALDGSGILTTVRTLDVTGMATLAGSGTLGTSNAYVGTAGLSGSGLLDTLVRMSVSGEAFQVSAVMRDGSGYFPQPITINGQSFQVVTSMRTGSVPFQPTPFIPPSADADLSWVFYDPTPRPTVSDPMPAPETYVLAVNPNKMSSPHHQLNINPNARSASQPRQSVYNAGVALVTQGKREVHKWTFSGVILDVQMFRAMRKWSHKRHRVQITDHFGRTWECLFESVTYEERRPTANHPRRYTYEASVLLYGRVS